MVRNTTRRQQSAFTPIFHSHGAIRIPIFSLIGRPMRSSRCILISCSRLDWCSPATSITSTDSTGAAS